MSMKVRMTDDSIRIRLGRNEISRLHGGESIGMTCHFPATASLSFVLGTEAEGDDITAAFSGQIVSVSVTCSWLDGWLEDDREGFIAGIDLGSDQSLEIRVEKDFKCLHRES